MSYTDQDVAIKINSGALTYNGDRTVDFILGTSNYVQTETTNIQNDDGGLYNEMPYSNQETNVSVLDVSLDASGSTVVLKEGPTGDVINTYALNDLQAVGESTTLLLKQKNSDKIQIGTIDPTTVTIN